MGERSARVRLRHHERHIRPGGTVSGPAMFTLADFAVYVAIIAALGEAGLDAVTTNLNINFLAKPEPRDLVAHVQPHPAGPPAGRRRGRDLFGRLPDMVAHAIATYALPTAAIAVARLHAVNMIPLSYTDLILLRFY